MSQMMLKILGSDFLSSTGSAAEVLRHDLLDLKDRIRALPVKVQELYIEDLKLPVRISNVFKRENVIKLSDVLAFEEQQIADWSGFGRKSVKQLKEIMDGFNAYDLERQVHEKQFREEEAKKAAYAEAAYAAELSEQPYLKNIIKILKSSNKWIEAIKEEHPKLFSEIEALSIDDDRSYLIQRRKISEGVLSKIDDYRFNSLLEEIDLENPISVLSISPAWLLDLQIQHLDTTARLKNFFEACNIHRLHDLCFYTVPELRLFKNMGAKSIRVLAASILEAYKKGPAPSTEQSYVNDLTLKENFFHSLQKVQSERHKAILEDRLGVSGRTKTLDELGVALGITRERVRQIQKKLTSKIIDGEYWDDLLKVKIESIRKSTSGPIYLDELHLRDPWFAGFSGPTILLQKIIEFFSHVEPNFIEVAGRTIMCSISPDDWNASKQKLTNMFEYSVDQQYSIEDLETLVESEMRSRNAIELSSLMFEQIYPDLIFSVRDGEFILTGLGTSKVALLRAILEESETPLHYEDVAKIYEKKFGVPIADRNVHAGLNCSSQFLNYDRGVYGISKHLKMSEAAQDNILKKSVEIILSLPDKQWNTEEIIQKAFQDFPEFRNGSLTKYTLNILLRRSSKIRYLGKTVWISEENQDSDSDRMHIKKAVADVLRAAGHAMNINDIRDEVVKFRSVGPYFCNMQPNELFSRVDAATWGLLDRDFALPYRKWCEIKDMLVSMLSERDVGLHISEIISFIKESAESDITQGQVQGVLLVDPRFRIWRGGLVGLSSWEDPKRPNVGEALETISKDFEDSLSKEEIIEKLEKYLGYSFDRYALAPHMGRLGFSFQRDKYLWVRD